MKKVTLSLALSAALAVAMAATPSEAATNKKAKAAKPAPIAAKSQPVMVGHFHSCVDTGRRMWGPIGGPVSAFGCGTVYAVPIMFETFLVPRRV